MKNRILQILTLCLLSPALIAQITITSEDMPSANDSVKMNTASNADAFDFVSTGANYSWDFSALETQDFAYDGYVSVSESPAIFQLVFNPWVANLAKSRPDLSIMTISIENGYTYYNNTSSNFSEVGYGAEINGFPIPVSYTSPDVIYEFPLTYQKSYTSQSSYNVQVPTLGSLSQRKERSTIVDGWGTVKTPYGTFECLRITSYINQEDSIYLESLPIPFPAIPSSSTEYIWLTKDEYFPVLKATDNGMLGMGVTYMDSSNYFEELLDPQEHLQYRIYPNPSSDFLVIETNQIAYSIEIYDVKGVRVFSKESHESQKVVFDVSPLAAGVYIIRMESAFHKETSKIIVH